MATSTTQPVQQLQVRRVFPVSPERLFQAWTAPEELKRWHAPDPMTVPLVEVDLRVGGSYRIHMREPGGQEYHVSGSYLVVEPPRKLVYTWKWDHDGLDTQVTLEFKPHGTGTELILTHEGLASEDSRGRHEHGWTSIFERLAGEHPVVSHREWLSARTALLAKEKEFTRLRDELSQERRDLPWERVEKEYRFDGPDGPESLADLFAGKSQLVVYHFMFAPDWDAGCPACSFWADNFNGIDVHLKHRNTTFLAISRAPLAQLEAYRKRMGWSFKWVSSGNTDFNFDYQASFRPDEVTRKQGYYNFGVTDPLSPEREGISVFYRDATGTVYHTYSTYARGLDLMNTAYNYLDLTPKGRDEGGRPMFWLERHDEYAS